MGRHPLRRIDVRVCAQLEAAAGRCAVQRNQTAEDWRAQPYSEDCPWHFASRCGSTSTAWAQMAMAAKNTLTAADCTVVEAAFAARLAELAEDGPSSETSLLATAGQAAVSPGTNSDGGHQPMSSSGMHSEDFVGEFGPPGRVNNAVAWHVDKGALTLSEPRRYRDRGHLRSCRRGRA
jgi:hypothetical protein